MFKRIVSCMLVAALVVAGVRTSAGNSQADQNRPYVRANETIALTNSVGMKLVPIPSGRFVMGSPANEDWRDNEEVEHQVTITRPFFIGMTPVTQAQWKAVMGDNPSEFKGDDLPVERISWEEAVDFCKKLSQREGKKYRLPTEAEWEYACRAGTTGPYGKSRDLDAVGWYHDNSGERTHPVALKAPNNWGLYDMHGNVEQWCSDWYAGYPGGNIQDPAGPAAKPPPMLIHHGMPIGPWRVVRGGTWNSSAAECRAAHRSRSEPRDRSRIQGFRVCMDF